MSDEKNSTKQASSQSQSHREPSQKPASKITGGKKKKKKEEKSRKKNRSDKENNKNTRKHINVNGDAFPISIYRFTFLAAKRLQHSHQPASNVALLLRPRFSASPRSPRHNF